MPRERQTAILENPPLKISKTDILDELRRSGNPTASFNGIEGWINLWQDIQFVTIFPDIVKDLVMENTKGQYNEEFRQKAFKESFTAFMQCSPNPSEKKLKLAAVSAKVFTAEGAVTSKPSKQTTDDDLLARAAFGFLILLGLSLEDRSVFYSIINEEYEKLQTDSTRRTFVFNFDNNIRLRSTARQWIEQQEKQETITIKGGFAQQTARTMLYAPLGGNPMSNKNLPARILPNDIHRNLGNYPPEVIGEFLDYAISFLTIAQNTSRRKDVEDLSIALNTSEKNIFEENSFLEEKRQAIFTLLKEQAHKQK